MADLSGAYALEDLIENAEKIWENVLICNAPPQVIKVLESVKVLDRVAQRNYLDVFHDAIDKAKEFGTTKIL